MRDAAALVGRHPETVRRWVWSGRLAAHRQGNRLVLAKADVEAVAGGESRATGTLAEWAAGARATREEAAVSGSARSAADLVLDDRERRSRPASARAGR